MYYKYPINFGAIMEGGDAATCSLPDNIAQHLQILITTRCGEHRYNSQYGNDIWNSEFENGINSIHWDDLLRKSIMESIKHHEPRLKNSTVEIFSEIVQKIWPLKKYTEIKRKIIVLVKGIITDNDEKFSYKTDLYLSPLSVD